MVRTNHDKSFGPAQAGSTSCRHHVPTSIPTYVGKFWTNQILSTWNPWKPKFKTVSNRNCHWLSSHPGVGVFLGFGATTKNALVPSWPMCGLKCLLCGVGGASNCLRPQHYEVLWHANMFCVFFLWFDFFLTSLFVFSKLFFFLCYYCNVFALLLLLVLRSSPFFPPDLPTD